MKKLLALSSLFVIVSANTVVSQDWKNNINPSSTTVDKLNNDNILEADLSKNNFKDSKSLLNCDSLQTTLAAGNSHNGVMFNVTSFADVTIKSFDVYALDTTKYKIYFRTSVYNGVENYPPAWTLIDSTGNIPRSPSGLTSLPNLSTPINIPSGLTYSFYITSKVISKKINYTNDTVNNFAAIDGNIGISVGCGLAYPFCNSASGAGGPFQDRKWNGKIHYCYIPAGIEEETFTVIKTSINPNPFRDRATIIIEGKQNTLYLLKIFNILGEEINTIENILGNEINIEKGRMSEGIYFYRLYNKLGAVGNGKFIIE